MEIRCLKLNSDNAYENEFPPLFSMKVDGIQVIKFDPMDKYAASRRRDTSV